MGKSEKVFKAGIKREQGWLYFLDRNCDVARSEMRRDGKRNSEVIARTGISEREEGYLYFIDKQGDVSRVKMTRGGTARRKRRKPEPIFKMRAKPTKPVRKEKTRRKKVTDFETLSDMMVFVEEQGLNPNDITFEHGRIVWESTETDAELKARTKRYKKRLEDWKVWAEENADKIAEHNSKKRK